MPDIRVIVLAAGKGERFKAAGGTQHKLDALLQGLSVRDHVLKAVQASGLSWHVVLPEHTQHVRNPGMADSIACGVAATRNADGWLILPADLPLIQPATLQFMAKALDNATQQPQPCDVVVPMYQQQRGHPVGFSKACLQDLLQLTGDKGAASVVAKHNNLQVPVDDVGCVTDVDTPALLEAAHQLLQAQKLQRIEMQSAR
jgi:molybdenum cofactor cytidylyltransferase